MNSAILKEASRVITEYCGKETVIDRFVSVGGGSINRAYRLSTIMGEYFLKHNRADQFPMMFEREAQGLRLLAASHTLRIPYVIGTGNASGEDFLLMEYLDRGKQQPDFWSHFGRQLAALHSVTQEYYGLDHDNYMGSLPQRNSFKMEFHEFFIENRLRPQLEMAADVLRDVMPQFERLYKKLPDLLPVEPPSLVHGDLWSGNFLTGPDGHACLIDPAVHFGHRESDVAMSKLFGGFDREFYEAYNEAKPLEKGWESRIDLFNLYPLLVHVNLFGGGYIAQIAAIVKRFS